MFLSIPLETACEIAGASIAAESDEAVVITRNYVSWCCEYKDEKNQYLLIDSNTGKGNFYKSALKCLTESSWSGTSFKYSLDDEGIINLLVDNFNQTKISCKYYDDELYVSFYEFLVMMGVDVDLIDHEATSASRIVCMSSQTSQQRICTLQSCRNLSVTDWKRRLKHSNPIIPTQS